MLAWGVLYMGWGRHHKIVLC